MSVPETSPRDILQKALTLYPQLKPVTIFDLPPLPVRIGAWLQELQGEQHQKNNPFLSDEKIRFADFTLESATGQLQNIKTGEEQILTEKERAFIVALARAPERKMERKKILELVWGYKHDLETHTLETHLYRLRQKIEADPANPVNLVTKDSVYYLAS